MLTKHHLTMPAFKLSKKMETRRLPNTDLKRLAQFLNGVPSSQSSRDELYHNNVKQEIKDLPRRAQQSILSLSSQQDLCLVHKGLNHNLLKELWSLIRHEFNSGIGKFIFPLIVGDMLTASEEQKIRQLEPVLQMYRKDFKLELSAAPGREPINRGVKWTFETEQCPACMLGRIGSDEKVLRALYAGMIGRFSARKAYHGKIHSAELTVAKLGNPKSKRLCFVRYWIKATNRGETLIHEATELGIKLKKLHHEWKDAQRNQRVSVYDGRCNLNDIIAFSSTEDSTAIDSVDEYPFLHPEHQPAVQGWDPLQDFPHSSHHPAVQGWDPLQDFPHSSHHHHTEQHRTIINTHRPLYPTSMHPYTHSSSHSSTDSLRPLLPHTNLDTSSIIHPSDSISQVCSSSARIAPLRIPRHKTSTTITNYPPPHASPPASIASTIQSYDGGCGPGAFHSVDPFATEEEQLEQYKALLRGPNPFADREVVKGMPEPRQESMYCCYVGDELEVDEEEDPFGDGDVDEDVEEEGWEKEEKVVTPAVVKDKGKERVLSKASTHWADLY